MINKINYLKILTILIIEDDPIIREKLNNLFTRLSAKVIVAKDGEEGLNILKSSGFEFDVVISDINMPKLDGLSLIEMTREFNKKINFIFVSAYSRPDYLLKAIKNSALNYFTKPIDLNELLERVQEIGEIKHHQIIVKTKNKENEDYLNILNQIAIISKTDLKGIITYVNDIFCEISGYDKEDLIGKSHNIVRHPDMPSAAFKDLWTTIQNKEIWKGKVKNLSKNGTAYFVNTTVYPILDEDSGSIIEYMSVRFLITDEELEKREFRKNVMKTIADNKRQNFVARNKIDELETKLKKLDYIDFIEKNLKLEKERSEKLNSQILYYENQMKQLKSNHEASSKTLKEESNMFYQELKSERKTNMANVQRIISLSNELESKEKEVLKLNQQVSEQNKIIINLKDVIDHREEELGLK